MVDDTFEYWYEFGKTLETEDHFKTVTIVRNTEFGNTLHLGVIRNGEILVDYTGVVKSPDARTIYILNNGLIHHTDIPSMYTQNGYVSFFEDGVVHRKNGPATIFENGAFVWALYGKSFDKFEDYIANNTYIDEFEKLELVMKYG